MSVQHQPAGLTWGAIVLAGLSGLGTMYVQFTHNDRENAVRISALEAHRTDDAGKLDHIQEQVDKLVAWALGR
jgi:hypothetical protein